MTRSGTSRRSRRRSGSGSDASGEAVDRHVACSRGQRRERDEDAGRVREAPEDAEVDRVHGEVSAEQRQPEPAPQQRAEQGGCRDGKSDEAQHDTEVQAAHFVHGAVAPLASEASTENHGACPEEGRQYVDRGRERRARLPPFSPLLQTRDCLPRANVPVIASHSCCCWTWVCGDPNSRGSSARPGPGEACDYGLRQGAESATLPLRGRVVLELEAWSMTPLELIGRPPEADD